MIRISVVNTNDTALKVSKVVEVDALNLARQALLQCMPMEETTADLKALAFINKVKAGNCMAVTNPKNNFKLVFRLVAE
jgi:hypothetical protein